MRRRTASILVVIATLSAAAFAQGPEPPPPPPPPELSAEAMQAILKSIGAASTPGTRYVRVTPRLSFVASKASLAFQNAYWVTSADQYARWKPPFNEQDKRVGLWVKSEGAGRKYAIDCSVRQDVGPKYPFKLWSSNTMLKSFTSTGEGQHLVFLLAATGAGWYAYQISGGPGWWFYSCEVTHL